MSTSPTAPSSDDLSLGAVVSGLEAARRRVAAAQADELRLLARAQAIAAEQTARIPYVAGREREMPARAIAADIGGALRRSDRVVQERMHEAATLVAGFAATVASLADGAIEVGHVRAIQDAGRVIDDPAARARFEQAALTVAERETVGRAKPIIAMLAQRIHPVPMAERHAEAATGRRVWIRDLDDGMAELAAVLPATLAYAIRDRLTQFAREITRARRARAAAAGDEAAAGDGAEAVAGDAAPAVEPADDPVATDTRSTDQIRADVLADMLLTSQAAAPLATGAIPADATITAHVEIVIPIDTLTGDGTEPAELIGYGPIDPETARRLAAGADLWERVFTSPITGAVVEVDTYRPSAAQRRHLDARDEHCRFFGCRRPARFCDHDHTIDAACGGPTSLCNLANLCTRHHTLKHATAWTVIQLAHGILQWTSPTGRVYPDIPRRVLEFTADSAGGHGRDGDRAPF
ncbi:DUF222 domain-containing protein [Microbacterium sp. Sa4CUA7]|uniref:DUF222 domain-containing protein n=1 Tax=Microbacterium pullorum TaxID=2762236 RepID=A0ABR8S044_9MICO|nr:HNH endonuclease signature motif containing protein [Microbacterium pullorum]MBD7956704.1 DUF222 domain-containing protein [Microbacterium pullorum]